MTDRPRGRRDFDPERPRRGGFGRGPGGARPPGSRPPGGGDRREGGFDRPRRDSDRPRREFDRPRGNFGPPGDRGQAGRAPGGGFDRPRRDFDRPRDRGFEGPPERPFDGPPERADRPFRPRPAFGRPPDRRPGGYSGPSRPYRSGPPHADRAPAPPRTDLVEDDAELIGGRRPVAEAFAARRQARRLLVVPERRAALESIVLHATTLRLPVVEVEGGTLTSLTGFDGHQGVALVVQQRTAATLEDIVVRARARDEEPFILVLDSLEDPQNLGTLLRSAEACGVHGVIYPTRHAAPLTAAAIKSSAGASEHLLLAAVDNLPGTLADLRAAGLRLVGADEGAGMRYAEADLRGPLALVVGSEERGISGALRRRLDQTVRIPMRGRVASLNAAVAGSVLLFAAAEQRGVPETGDRPPIDDPPLVHAPTEAAPSEQSATAGEPAGELGSDAAAEAIGGEESGTDGAPSEEQDELLPGGPGDEVDAVAEGHPVDSPAGEGEAPSASDADEAPAEGDAAGGPAGDEDGADPRDAAEAPSSEDEPADGAPDGEPEGAAGGT
jgi:23S rRNA (guanosine2251-2'-O)-methyltransferase